MALLKVERTAENVIMDIDPFDKRKADIEDEMCRAADEAAHRDEAVWLLTHMELYPRDDKHRAWYERWKVWYEREMALRE